MVIVQGDSRTDAVRCTEMQEGRPWCFQADAYAAAGEVHCMLYGEYMHTHTVMDEQGEQLL